MPAGPPHHRTLELLATHTDDINRLDLREKELVKKLAATITATGSSLDELVGISDRSVAELLVETGDPRRFTEGGYARFNGTAPIPVSSGEGDGEPVRHRLNRGGNRRINAVLHRMARHPVALRTASPSDLRQRPRARPHQEGSDADPQAPPLQRRLEAHDPRPRRRLN